MTDEPIRAQLTQEVAAGQLEHAALQFTIIHAAIRQGETSQALLHARRVAVAVGGGEGDRGVLWQSARTERLHNRRAVHLVDGNTKALAVGERG